MIETINDLKFQDVNIDNYKQFKLYFDNAHFRGAEYSANTVFIWSKVLDTQVCFHEDFVIIKALKTTPTYLFPALINQNLKTIVELMENDAKNNNQPFRMHSVNELCRKELEELFPNKYFFFPSRNDFDYIYNIEELINLKGKKFHGKRNFVNRFIKTYENSYRFETINELNITKCFDLNNKWSIENDVSTNKDKQKEQIALLEALNNYFSLNFTGGLLFIKDEPVALAIGEPLTNDTFLVHFEKALTEYKGVYQIINKKYLETFCNNFKYVNREDDAGSHGLRKSKLSYNPVSFEKKYLVRIKDQVSKSEFIKLTKLEEENEN